MRFRLTTIFWVFALLASALATFGVVGVFAFFSVILFWAAVWRGQRAASFLEVLVLLAFVGILITLLLPAVSSVREVARIMVCQNNLKQIVLSLHNYHDDHGSFPLAQTPDSDGMPMHSWRVQILPYLESSRLFDSYDFSEAWDGPNNIKIANSRMQCYECPSDPPPTLTPQINYFAVVGSRTAWPLDQPRKLEEIKDGASTTILLIDVAERSVVWSEPKDLTFDEAVDLLTSTNETLHRRETSKSFFYKPYSPSEVRNVAFVDGSVRSLPLPLSKELAVALLTVDGGEEIDKADFDRVTQPQLDYGRIYSFSVFVVMALLPAGKLWLRGSGDASHRG